MVLWVKIIQWSKRRYFLKCLGTYPSVRILCFFTKTLYFCNTKKNAHTTQNNQTALNCHRFVIDNCVFDFVCFSWTILSTPKPWSQSKQCLAIADFSSLTNMKTMFLTYILNIAPSLANIFKEAILKLFTSEALACQLLSVSYECM